MSAQAPGPESETPGQRRARFARNLQEALAILRPADRSHLRTFMLRHDTEVDLGVISNQLCVGQASMLSAEAFYRVGLAFEMDTLLVPFVNLGKINVGIVIVGSSQRVSGSPSSSVTQSPSAGAEGAARKSTASTTRNGSNGIHGTGIYQVHQWDDMSPLSSPNPANPRLVNLSSCKFSLGRYLRDEETGEVLYVLSNLSSSGVASVSIISVGAPYTIDRRSRVTITITCDGESFAKGRLLDSVISCERTVRVQRDSPRMLCMPTHSNDLSKNAANMATYSGTSAGFRDENSARASDLIPVENPPIFTSVVNAMTHWTSSDIRNTLLGVAVRNRAGLTTPSKWSRLPMADIFSMALERLTNGVTALNLGHAVDDDVYQRAEEAVNEFQFDGSRARIEAPPFAQSPEPYGSTSAFCERGSTDDPSSPHTIDILPGTGDVRDARVPVPLVQHLPLPQRALVTKRRRKTPPGSDGGAPSTPEQVGGEEASERPLTAAEADLMKKERRRAANNAAAKRSNAKKKLMYNQLVENLELSKGTLTMLKRRWLMLTEENAQLRETLQAAGRLPGGLPDR